MSLTLIGTTKNGHDVLFNTDTSHALTHFQKNPGLQKLVQKSIPKLIATKEIERYEIDIGEFVGMSDLIETTADDKIIYALRPLRLQYSRFVKNKQPQPTLYIVIDLRKDTDGIYTLYTAYIGKLTPSFPGGDFMPEQSKEFWSHHALVWGTQEIIEGSETTENPW
jgi:hypothetical protein